MQLSLPVEENTTHPKQSKKVPFQSLCPPVFWTHRAQPADNGGRGSCSLIQRPTNSRRGEFSADGNCVQTLNTSFISANRDAVPHGLNRALMKGYQALERGVSTLFLPPGNTVEIPLSLQLQEDVTQYFGGVLFSASQVAASPCLL